MASYTGVITYKFLKLLAFSSPSTNVCIMYNL